MKTNFKLLFITLIISCGGNDRIKQNLFEIGKVDTIFSKELTENVHLEYFNAPNDIGTGILEVKMFDSSFFTLYKDSTLNEPLSVSTLEPTELIPVFFKPDYGIFYMICLDQTKDYFVVLGKSYKRLFAKRNLEDFEFFDWKNVLTKKALGIENKDWEVNRPMKKFNSQLETYINEGDDLRVIDMKEEWIEIIDEDENKGWIKWRDGNKLLIDIYFLM